MVPVTTPAELMSPALKLVNPLGRPRFVTEYCVAALAVAAAHEAIATAVVQARRSVARFAFVLRIIPPVDGVIERVALASLPGFAGACHTNRPARCNCGDGGGCY